MRYKQPRSVQVVIFAVVREMRLYLLLKRVTHVGGFWQSVTGSLEAAETHKQAAIREVLEETSIVAYEGQLIDLKLTNEFEIASERIAQYAPGVTRNEEVCFALEVEKLAVKLDEFEHQNYAWVEYETALDMISYESTGRALAAVERLIPQRSNGTPFL